MTRVNDFPVCGGGGGASGGGGEGSGGGSAGAGAPGGGGEGGGSEGGGSEGVGSEGPLGKDWAVLFFFHRSTVHSLPEGQGATSKRE